MGWKDGKKPEQYLFTITEDFSDNWKALKDKAKKDKNNIIILRMNLEIRRFACRCWLAV